MNSSQTTSRIGAVLGTIVAIVVVAGSAQAATSTPAGMSQPESRALIIRSEGLNKLHGKAVTRLSPRVFEELDQAGAHGVAPHGFPALVARSEALNRQYGLDRRGQPTTAVEQPTGSGNGFDWGDLGVGGAATLGLVLLSGGLLAGAYFGRKTGVRPRPVT